MAFLTLLCELLRDTESKFSPVWWHRRTLNPYFVSNHPERGREWETGQLAGFRQRWCCSINLSIPDWEKKLLKSEENGDKQLDSLPQSVIVSQKQTLQMQKRNRPPANQQVNFRQHWVIHPLYQPLSQLYLLRNIVIQIHILICTFCRRHYCLVHSWAMFFFLFNPENLLLHRCRM